MRCLRRGRLHVLHSRQPLTERWPSSLQMQPMRRAVWLRHATRWVSDGVCDITHWERSSSVRALFVFLSPPTPQPPPLFWHLFYHCFNKNDSPVATHQAFSWLSMTIISDYHSPSTPLSVLHPAPYLYSYTARVWLGHDKQPRGKDTHRPEEQPFQVVRSPNSVCVCVCVWVCVCVCMCVCLCVWQHSVMSVTYSSPPLLLSCLDLVNWCHVKAFAQLFVSQPDLEYPSYFNSISFPSSSCFLFLSFSVFSFSCCLCVCVCVGWVRWTKEWRMLSCFSLSKTLRWRHLHFHLLQNIFYVCSSSDGTLSCINQLNLTLIVVSYFFSHRLLSLLFRLNLSHQFYSPLLFSSTAWRCHYSSHPASYWVYWSLLTICDTIGHWLQEFLA